MKHTEFQWFAMDGKLVYAQMWQPDAKPKAVIILVHGMGEHSGRYQHVAEFFVARQFAVLGFDLRGHGRSEGKRGHASLDILHSQIDKAVEEAGKRFSGIPKFIWGHSLGGNLVINYALTRYPRVLGLIVTSPWLKLDTPVPSSKLILAKVMSNIWGGYTESNGLDANQLSHDKAVIDAYVKDPLVHDKVSVRLFMDGQQSAEYSLAKASSLKVSMLLMHGSEDKITSPSGSREFAQKADDYVDYKEWEGLFHETHNEPQKDEVLEFAYNWMLEQLRIDKKVVTL